jgi:hypothetical protein
VERCFLKAHGNVGEIFFKIFAAVNTSSKAQQFVKIFDVATWFRIMDMG